MRTYFPSAVSRPHAPYGNYSLCMFSAQQYVPKRRAHTFFMLSQSRSASSYIFRRLQWPTTQITASVASMQVRALVRSCTAAEGQRNDLPLRDLLFRVDEQELQSKFASVSTFNTLMRHRPGPWTNLPSAYYVSSPFPCLIKISTATLVPELYIRSSRVFRVCSQSTCDPLKSGRVSRRLH